MFLQYHALGDKRSQDQDIYGSTSHKNDIMSSTLSLADISIDPTGMPDLLSCPVCYEKYTSDDPKVKKSRAPLFLSCHHSVCKQCLPKLLKYCSKLHKDQVNIILIVYLFF